MKADSRDRVLVLASTFPSSAADPVPAFVRDQVVALAEQHPDIDFSVLAPHDRRSQTKTYSVHPGYTEHRFHYFWPRRAEQLAGRGIMPALRQNPALYLVVPFLFFGEFIATLRLARRLRPALIYAHWFTPQAIVASLVSRMTRIPFVFTTHASDVDVWRRVPGLGPQLVRAACANATAITAVSSRSRAKLTAFFGENDTAVPVDVIPMGVFVPDAAADPRERAALRTRLGFDGKVVYLSIGRLVEKKGLRFLLEALEQVEEELADWVLVIAGDGPLRDEIQAAVSTRGLSDRVVFAGFVTGLAKEQYFRAADVLVVPSIVASDGDAEGLPVALLEGLAHGLICIATNESGADDVVTHGIDGFLCPQQDGSALAAQLTAVDALGADEREALAGRARDLARQFSWAVIAQRHYDALIAPIIRGSRVHR